MFISTGVVGRLAAAALALLALPAVQAQFGGMNGMGGMGSGMGAGMGSGIGGGQSPFQSPRLSFRPWIAANGAYSENLTEARSGARNSFSSYGGAAGISGGKAFSRTMVSAFYTGVYQRYTRANNMSGFNNVGGISVSHQASQKLAIFASEFAGSSNGGFGYGAAAGAFGGWGTVGSSLFSDLAGGGIGFGDPASNGIVDNEIFSTRVHFTGTSGGFSYQPDLRWSVTGSGTAAFVRRKANGLSDLNSVSSAAQLGYRISEGTQVGVMYQYGQFSYPQMFGGNRVQSVGAGIRQRLGKQATFQAMVGGYRLDTTSIGRFSIDPSIASLLGQSTTLDIFKGKRLGWTGSANISRSWRTWSASLAYNHGINPGNGVMLASNRDSAVGSASTQLGRVNIGAFGGYYRMSGIIQRGASLDSFSTGASAGVRLFSEIYLGGSAGYSRFEGATNTAQWRRFFAAHISWSPEGAAFRF